MRIFFFITIFFSQLSFSSDNNYVFGWTQLDNPDLMTPRGGTSSGPDVDLDKNPNPFWKQIQNDELNKFEKDRLAILAMQGEHKINFDMTIFIKIIFKITLDIHTYILHLNIWYNQIYSTVTDFILQRGYSVF